MAAPRFIANRLFFRVVISERLRELNGLRIEKVFVGLGTSECGVGVLVVNPGKKGLISVTGYRSIHKIDCFVSEALGDVVFAIGFEFEGAIGFFVFRVSVVIPETYLIELIPDLSELFVGEQVVFLKHSGTVVRLLEGCNEVGYSRIDR